MTNSKRIFGAFTIAIALFFLWPVVFGGWAKIGALRAAVAERESILAQREKILANVRSAYSEYTQKLAQEDGKKFAALVPVRKDSAEIVSAVHAIAGDSGVQLGELRTTETKAAGAEQYKTLSLTMDVAGSYASMRQFLASLEQYVRLLNVDTIEASVDASNEAQLRFTIRADAYFIK